MQDTLLPREKWLIAGVLVLLTIAAWGLTIYQSGTHTGMGGMATSMPRPHQPVPMAASAQDHGGMMPGRPMQADAKAEASTAIALEVVLFLPMWLAMMIAMMFPSAYPMVFLFARVSKGQTSLSNQTQLPTWLFVTGYLTIWTLIGGLMYVALLLVRWIGGQVGVLGEWGFLGSGIALIGAGLYQFSPWKGVCLTHCRSPLGFILHRWRSGALGAWRMGIDHGAYCVGCCWGLMLVMFVMGLMSLVWMGLLTVVIFLEKVTRHGPLLRKVIGGVLISLGVGLLIHPSLLPHLSV
jgi:predicted metal-binding membrane protein